MDSISVGVDVGGTFTDFIMLDNGNRKFKTAKVATTIDDRAVGFFDGLRVLDVPIESIDWLVHGTTAGTNAVLERNGARCGLITTKGFRDVLELGRRTRPNAYGLSGGFQPLIDRCDRLEVSERIDAKGNILTILSEADVNDAIDYFLEAGIESIVIHFLHSYVNPLHEKRCAEIVRKRWPNSNVVAGYEIVQEMREFERGTTAAIHASIRPVVSDYIERVNDRLRAENFQNELLVMQANGGMMASSIVGQHAVHTIMSGPAAGVLAAAEIARSVGIKQVITGDMGGTSYDVAVIANGKPIITAEKDLAYAVPIRIPMIDIHSIGAGGGSIARVDKAGMLRVGPESSGSYPGPIGYGNGGFLPTITDANFLLGRINSQSITGSNKVASLENIANAMSDHIGKELNLDAYEVASAIVEVAVQDLAGAIRLISIDKGYDPRDFTFMPYGGAGPLHAVAIARELGLSRVLVPRFPGLTSALGCIMADVRHDFVRTVNKAFEELDSTEIISIIEDQERAGKELLEKEKVSLRRVQINYEFDILYRGQSHSMTIPIDKSQFNLEIIIAQFAEAYFKRFSLSFPEMMPVLINVRTTVIGVRDSVDLSLLRPENNAFDKAILGSRLVYFNGDWHKTTTYDRELLPVGSVIIGPAIIEQADTTIVVDPNSSCCVDEFGNILIELG